MASKTALPIARLRSLGCKVSTVIGHDPNISDFIYSVRLPDNYLDLRETPTLSPLRSTQGNATAYVPKHSDGKHLVVKACSYRVREPLPSKDVRLANEADVAGLLNRLADVMSKASA